MSGGPTGAFGGGGTPEVVPEEAVSTGSLPSIGTVMRLIRSAHERFGDVREGEVADYIPALAEADPELFGIAVAGLAGNMGSVGDAAVPFSIQSVSKAFVLALVVEAIGAEAARERLGFNATGQPFNSVVAVELSPQNTTNPLVNAGAIATTSLLPGADPDEKWETLQAGLARFAGRPLALDDDVYASEAAHNQRNRGMAHLLESYGLLYFDAEQATDLYTRQCSLLVTAEDLAVMGATLADGGTNPVTGERVVSPRTAQVVLAVLATAGLYERSGDWLVDVGLPGKSGVSGGIVTVAPGKGGLAVFSPPLDAAGNSVRGVLVTRYLSRLLGLDVFASRAVPPGDRASRPGDQASSAAR